MKNCLICLVDSLRYDMLPGKQRPELFQKYDLETKLETPVLKELLERGIEFPNLHSTFPATPPAVASLLTGQYPREHQLCGFYRPLGEQAQTLADYFSRAGFHTILMNGMKLFEKAGIQQRFDEHLEGPLYRMGERITELNQAGKRVFGYIHTFDVHHPYLISKYPPNEEYHDPIVGIANALANQLNESVSFDRGDAIEVAQTEELPYRAHEDMPLWQFMHRIRKEYIETEGRLEEPIKLLSDLYVRGLSQFDNFQLAPLVEFLINTAAGRETLFFLTADHGEMTRQGKNQITFDHGGKPVENVVRVPGILLNSPDPPNFERSGQLTSLVDVAPTLLAEFEEPKTGADISGIDLHQPAPEKREIFVEYSSAIKKHEESGEIFPRIALLEWQCLLSENGYKLYRRGEKLKDSDYDLPLPEFFRRVMAKRLQKWAEEHFIEQCVEDFQGTDNLESRKEFVTNLLAGRETADRELYDWQEDPAENTNLLAEATEDHQEIARRLEPKLCLRFPYTREFDDSGPEMSGEEEEKLKDSLEGLGYL